MFYFIAIGTTQLHRVQHFVKLKYNIKVDLLTKSPSSSTTRLYFLCLNFTINKIIGWLCGGSSLIILLDLWNWTCQMDHPPVSAQLGTPSIAIKTVQYPVNFRKDSPSSFWPLPLPAPVIDVLAAFLHKESNRFLCGGRTVATLRKTVLIKKYSLSYYYIILKKRIVGKQLLKNKKHCSIII